MHNLANVMVEILIVKKVFEGADDAILDVPEFFFLPLQTFHAQAS